MLISFVLRLLPGRLLVGQLAGEVEHVPTGQTASFRDAAELQAWCTRVGAAADGDQAASLLPQQSPNSDDRVQT